MTQPDKDDPHDLEVSAHIRIPRRLLMAALLEALRQQPDLLAAAVAVIHPPESQLANRPPPWPSDAESFGAPLA